MKHTIKSRNGPCIDRMTWVLFLLYNSLFQYLYTSHPISSPRSPTPYLILDIIRPQTTLSSRITGWLPFYV
jgi:hypothetical protein